MYYFILDKVVHQTKHSLVNHVFITYIYRSLPDEANQTVNTIIISFFFRGKQEKFIGSKLYGNHEFNSGVGRHAE
jgi:hypothetical protein